MISLNRRAAQIVQGMMADAEALGLSVHRLANGTTVIDAGIAAPGSLLAGQRFAEACLGGLGRVDMVRLDFRPEPGRPFWLPGVAVTVSWPGVACLVSQGAGWRVSCGGWRAMGSGPARSLSAEDSLGARLAYLGYREEADTAVLLLEGRSLPGADAATQLAEACHVDPEKLYLLIAPTASLVGSVQIAARVVETALHKLMELGFDLRQVLESFGVCPLAPVAGDDLTAMGRTNEAVLYGGQAFLAVRAADEELERLVPLVPSSASRDYGVPFLELYRRYGSFYDIDPLLFSPAEVTVNNLASGRVFRAGGVDAGLLERALLGEGEG